MDLDEQVHAVDGPQAQQERRVVARERELRAAAPLVADQHAGDGGLARQLAAVDHDRQILLSIVKL